MCHPSMTLDLKKGKIGKEEQNELQKKRADVSCMALTCYRKTSAVHMASNKKNAVLPLVCPIRRSTNFIFPQ